MALCCRETRKIPFCTELVHQAISHVSQERNGYLAWTLYAHLRQGGLVMDSQDLAALAGAMLHVDRELYTEHCVKRALSVLDYARSIGEADDIGLLGQACAACAVGGLADRAQLLCEEGDYRPPSTNLPKKERDERRHAKAMHAWQSGAHQLVEEEPE